MRYDFIIVGGGIAGLYLGYLLKKYTNASFLILEADDHFGGRAFNVLFAGISVPTGAGVGRKAKDKYLLELMRELDMSIQTFPVRHAYSPKIKRIDMEESIDRLKQNFQGERETFKTFATRIWGKKLYNDFLIYNGYRDMEQEGIFETLNYYGLDDNYKRWIGFKVDWNDLVKRICDFIGKKHLRLNQSVQQIKKVEEGYRIDDSYSCKNLILAVPTNIVSRLLPRYKKLYDEIGTQSFLRTYVQFDAYSSLVMKEIIQGTTVVSNIFQKIIPMNSKGVYMIAYNDNKNASKAKNMTRSQIIKDLRKEFNISEPLRITRLQHFYWKVGTHYYKPLHRLFNSRKEFIQVVQHPQENVFVIGESVSTNQGWVEGSLESVRNILKKITYIIEE